MHSDNIKLLVFLLFSQIRTTAICFQRSQAIHTTCIMYVGFILYMYVYKIPTSIYHLLGIILLEDLYPLRVIKYIYQKP